MKYLVLLSLILCHLLSRAQTLQTNVKNSHVKMMPQNSINIELLGKSGLYSLNYDKMFGTKALLGLGFSYYSATVDPNVINSKVSILSLPVYSHFYFTKGRHKPFLMGGVNFINIDGSAEFSLSKLFNGSSLSVKDEHGSKKEVSVNASGLEEDVRVSLTLALPMLAVGYEYRSSEAILFRTQAYIIVADKVTPWIGSSFGVAF